MKRIVFILLILLGVTDSHAIPFNWYDVRNPGNAADHTGLGAVDYKYRISDEVLSETFATFIENKESDLISVLGEPADVYYHELEAVPVRYFLYSTTPFGLQMFANWVNNGRGDADVFSGAYTITNNAGQWTSTFDPHAGVHIPTIHEWYKARYIENVPIIHEYATNPLLEEEYFGGEWLEGYWQDVPVDAETIAAGIDEDDPFYPNVELSLLIQIIEIQNTHNPISVSGMPETVSAPAELFNFLPLSPSGTFRLAQVIPEPSTALLFLCTGLLATRRRINH